ncbi:hypothetical protein FQN52_008986 [Onygenales sp. PD_12]|nr:hypothetical protein FQN53_003536 [Emmonsiellopsis sp. PD_33]KAK2784564.1 hypothetical protein FQN52_008986 [Onygenales sp. PD_12]
MRPALYLFAALVASGVTLGSAIPSEDDLATEVIDTDLKAVPDGEVQKRDIPSPGEVDWEAADPEGDLEKRSASPDPEGDAEDLSETIDIDQADLKPIPDGELDKRGFFECIVYVCKNTDRTNCYEVNTGGKCINLKSSNGKPFVSGTTAGSNCLCTAYSRKGCPWIRGKDAGFQYARSWGWSAKSLKCSKAI